MGVVCLLFVYYIQADSNDELRDMTREERSFSSQMGVDFGVKFPPGKNFSFS